MLKRKILFANGKLNINNLRKLQKIERKNKKHLNLKENKLIFKLEKYCNYEIT